jgi:phosphatidylinositol alpha-mannosyltransferase
MRIGIVSPYDLAKPGGVQNQVLGLAATLRRSGEDALVIGPGLPDVIPGVDLGGSVTVPGNGSRAPISIDPRVRGRIRKAVRDLDVLHLHEPLMPMACLFALRSGPPVVATFHAAPGGLGRSLYRALGGRLRSILGDRVTRITAVSASAAAPLPDGLAVTIIPNGLDVAAFQVETEKKPGRVVFLGRDEPRKGLDLLLEAWKTVVEVVPDAQLIVVGANRRREGIQWVGRVSDADKARILAGASVFAAPNTGGESFGITLVEAMAAGTAVVASDLLAFQDVAGDAALYFETGSSQRLAERLVEILGDDSLRSRLESEGRRRAARFDWPAIASAYLAEYRSAALGVDRRSR